ncbi:MAG: hypothetical protein NT150_05750 [Bacteroidetes bacterium]|nr:hypothetical protein [Bacteroidota bacterium]
MTKQETQVFVDKMFDAIEKLIPVYMQDPIDNSISNGNVAVVIIDESGIVYGRMYGSNKPRMRQSYKVAWTKASQVWLTGVKTGEYEKMVFTGVVDENANGIDAPDLIGWAGGQPMTTKSGVKFSVGFSGFRGFHDNEIMVKALAEVDK